MTIKMCERFKANILALAWAFMTLLVLAAAPGLAQDAATESTEDATAEAPAEPQGLDQSDIVATIGQKVLTVQDLAREFANRGTSFGSNLAVAQIRLRDTVIAEYWVDQNFAQLAVRDPRTALALGEAQRQVLFEVYAQSTFPREDVTEEDIAAYVADNPDVFSDRRSYVYQRILVIAQDQAQLDAARQALEGLLGGANAPSDFASLSSRFADTGANFAVTRQWTSTESLTPDLRSRLWAMWDEDRRVDTVDTGQGFDVLFLIDSYDDPADPVQMQSQIVNRIQQERYATHRLNLAQSIAAPLIGTLPEPVEDVEFKPTIGILAASAIAGAIFGLVISMLALWVRSARIAADVMEKASLGDFRPRLRNHPTFVKSVVIVLVLALLGEIVFGLLFGPIWVRSLEVLAAFFGTLLLCVVLGVLIGRGRRDLNEDEAVRKLRLVRRCCLLFTFLVLVGGGVAVLFPESVSGLLDYLL